MGENLSAIDRGIRVIIGLALIWAVLYVPMAVALLWGFTILGILLMPTGLAGYCPIYSVLKIRTK